MYLQLNLQQTMSEIVIKYYMSHNLGNIYGRNWYDKSRDNVSSLMAWKRLDINII
jgi:hypothetical protein